MRLKRHTRAVAWIWRYPVTCQGERVPGGGRGPGIVEGRRRYPGAAQVKKKPSRLSHYDDSGRAPMVDVSAKAATKRTAIAHAFVRIRPSVLKKLPDNPKGDPLESGAHCGHPGAAKRTSDLIPMCHPLMLSHVDVETSRRIARRSHPGHGDDTGPTGVEMEALTAAAVAALTIYDMTKALDKGIEIQDLYLLEKRVGRAEIIAR